MTKVRLTSAEEWPEHNIPAMGESRKGWAKARGMEITIGAPVAPNKADWNCNTDVVWPVLEWDRTLGQPCGGYEVFVCRHMIEAGD